jgi:hypothetical protein
MEPKPNVFPTNSSITASPNPISSDEIKKIQVDGAYEQERIKVAEEIYTNAATSTGMDAIEQMRQRTLDQIAARDAQLDKNTADIANYQTKFAEAQKRPATNLEVNVAPQVLPSSPAKSPITKNNFVVTPIDTSRNEYIESISQQQWNMSFDVLPLPSEGKLYKSKKPTVKVAYMTTADENILTSPNLLQSGEFLEILINRKLLDTNLRYKDLHVGDRNMIMLWLRASSYGEMYPVTLLDENDVPFDTEINLNELKTKKLNVEPDVEGLFDFVLPLCKSVVKFKLLNVGELEEVEKLTETDKNNNIPVDSTPTYMLERQIVEIDGIRDAGYLKDFIETMRLNDSKELTKKIAEIDCGVDLELEVRTPGGGSIKTFLPLNIKFFWPNLSI